MKFLATHVSYASENPSPLIHYLHQQRIIIKIEEKKKKNRNLWKISDVLFIRYEYQSAAKIDNNYNTRKNTLIPNKFIL